MFDTLLEELHTTIHEHGGNLIDLPEEFEEYISVTKKAHIFSWLWDVPGYRRWRVTRLNAGENLQVLNSVAYPIYSKDKPIMGIDLLWFGKKNKLVAVLDFQPLIQDKNYFDKYFEELKLLRERFPKFNNQTDMFVYDPEKYFSPWVLFCKGGIEEMNGQLNEIFSSFLQIYLNLDKNPNKNSFNLSAQEVQKLQTNYDKYSAEKDPAHGLFSSFFGKSWSDRFLKEFLFPFS